MSLKKFLLVALTAVVVCGGFALECQAQNPFKRQFVGRWLGQGVGDGYHRCNPGYDSSYYNPYSAHNSTLVSQSPEYLALEAQQAFHQPAQRFFSGVPFSVYAAPPQLNSALSSMPGQQIQGTFSPSVGSGSKSAPDNSFPVKPVFENNIDQEDDLEDDDNDFRDDQEFRDDHGDEPEKESMEFLDEEDNLDIEKIENGGGDADVDSDDLGGLSGLNDSLSFDFD